MIGFSACSGMASFLFIENETQRAVASWGIQPDGLTPLRLALCVDNDDDVD
jgi:hypothetical protein